MSDNPWFKIGGWFSSAGKFTACFAAIVVPGHCTYPAHQVFDR